MLSRFAACWLVVLIVAPFTAPFSTCDLTTVLGAAPAQHARVARHARVPRRDWTSEAMVSEAAIPDAPVAVSNDVAVPAAPAIGRVSRGRLSRVFGTSTFSNDISSS